MKYFLITVACTFLSATTYSQARSGIGIAFDVNKPFSNNDYQISYGGNIEGSIALNDKWAIIPAIGVENMDGNGRAIYGPYNIATRHIEDIGLIYAGLYGKYFFKKDLFVRAGSMLFVGGDGGGIAAAGIGGSAGAGYSFKADKHNSFELSLNTDMVYVADSPGTIPIVSVKLAYLFNFKGRD